MAGEMLHATYNGRDYDIPAIWMAGAVRSLEAQRPPRQLAGATILEAVALWAYQQELAERDAR